MNSLNLMTEDFRDRHRRILKKGYAFGETARFHVWDSRFANPCGHPVEGLAKLRRLLTRNPHLYATGSHGAARPHRAPPVPPDTSDETPNREMLDAMLATEAAILKATDTDREG